VRRSSEIHMCWEEEDWSDCTARRQATGGRRIKRGWSSEALVKLGSMLSTRPDREVGDARDTGD
jgi:hypothetical protein